MRDVIAPARKMWKQLHGAALMMSKLKLQAAASVTPVRAMSCVRAEQREAASAAQAEGENSGRDYEQAESAGGGERHARQGDELCASRAANGAGADRLRRKLWDLPAPNCRLANHR